MYFTQNDFETIYRWLQNNSMKDSEFNDAEYPLSGLEYVSFIQNNKNVKMPIKEFIRTLSILGAAGFINVTDSQNTALTLQEAIEIVPNANRITGLVITFLNKEINNWQMYQYVGTSINDWDNLTLWRDIWSEGAFKGFFTTNTVLQSTYPNPTIGEYAVVGNTLADAVVYRCTIAGTWSETEENAQDVINIDIEGVTIGVDGYYYINGMKTTTRAQGWSIVDVHIDNTNANNVGVASVQATLSGEGDKTLNLKFNSIKGEKGDKGDNAYLGEATAEIDNNIGTPTVEVQNYGTSTNRELHFIFKNLKGHQGDPGPKGDRGDTGLAAEIQEVTAAITEDTAGTRATVGQRGTPNNRSFDFTFYNIKGDKGDKGDAGVDGKTPVLSINEDGELIANYE